MQDTNPLQYLLLESFWERCNLFCVGDDAQSIYGFRGADFKSIHNFVNIVPDAQVKQLTLNYRSTQEILDISNWLLMQSPLNYDKILTASRGHGVKPELCHFNQEWDEARDIVMRIKNSQGEEGAHYHDNMVLSRTNWGLKGVEACLVEAQIPYQIFGGTSLMASAHVRDVVAALRIVANHKDELAWERYLCLFPRVGEITAAKIIDRLLDLNSLEECLDILAGETILDPAATSTLMDILNLEAEVSQAIEAAFKGLDKILERIYKDDWPRRRKDLALLKKIGLSSDSLVSFISDYILDPALATGLKNEEADPDDCVILTTIHSAKGLEATNCYLLNVNYNQYPSSRAVANGEDAIEEDRRCLYVALTRAKDRLVIYRSRRAAQVLEADDDDGQRYFLNNIPSKLYEFSNIGGNSTSWGDYRGSGISFYDASEFDFS